MASLKKLARGKDHAQLMEDVVFNANALEAHGITLPDNPTVADLAAALQKLLDILARRD